MSWIAFKDLNKSDVLRRAGFLATGEAAEIADERTPFTFATFPTGWSTIFSSDYRYGSSQGLAHLSQHATVLGCQIEEHIMCSAAALFTDGRELWRVAHESEKGRYDLSVFGAMPTPYEPIRRALFDKQDNDGGTHSAVDFVYDIPIELCQALTGYRHDVWKLAWGEQRYERLEPVRAG